MPLAAPLAPPARAGRKRRGVAHHVLPWAHEQARGGLRPTHALQHQLHRREAVTFRGREVSADVVGAELAEGGARAAQALVDRFVRRRGHEEKGGAGVHESGAVHAVRHAERSEAATSEAATWERGGRERGGGVHGGGNSCGGSNSCGSRGRRVVDRGRRRGGVSCGRVSCGRVSCGQIVVLAVASGGASGSSLRCVARGHQATSTSSL